MGWEPYNILTYRDLIMAPLVLIFLYWSALQYRKAKYENSNLKKYFLPALHLRMLGCFISALMYEVYYHGGDTFGYYLGVTKIYDTFFENPALALKFMFYPPESLVKSEYYALIATPMAGWYFNSYNSALLMQIGSFFSLFTFNSYLSIGFILSFFSFIGCWKLFEVFYDLYPKIEKELAFACLYIPSVFFWGSAGLMKDTIIMACVGYFTWSAYYFFIKKEKMLKSGILLLVSFYLMFSIKSYVAISFIPAVTAWIILRFQDAFSSKVLKLIFGPFIIFISIGAALFFLQSLAANNPRYALDQIVDYALTMQQYHASVTEEAGGTGYSLGEIDPSFTGLIKKIPSAVFVTLFRPFIWEVKKIILIPSVIEAFVALMITLYVFMKAGFFTVIKNILKDSNLLFCLLFTIVFAFSVGFSSYNFGALARYKIPVLPFFFISLTILFSSTKSQSISTAD